MLALATLVQWLGCYACVLAPLASETADAPSIPAPPSPPLLLHAVILAVAWPSVRVRVGCPGYPKPPMHLPSPPDVPQPRLDQIL